MVVDAVLGCDVERRYGVVERPPDQDVLIAAALGSSGGSADWKIIATLAVAAIALIGVLIKLWVDGRRAHCERLRELYAGGWAAVQAYEEMAFAIRRRNHQDRASERVRLSEAMRKLRSPS